MQITIQDFYNYYVSKANKPMNIEEFTHFFPQFWNIVMMGDSMNHIPFLLPNGKSVWLGVEDIIRKIAPKT